MRSIPPFLVLGLLCSTSTSSPLPGKTQRLGIRSTSRSPTSQTTSAYSNQQQRQVSSLGDVQRLNSRLGTPYPPNGASADSSTVGGVGRSGRTTSAVFQDLSPPSP